MGPESIHRTQAQRSVVVPAPSTPVCPPPQSGGPPPQDGWRGWKGLLAVLALCLSGLIWIAGLVDSLSRPSVVNALDIRELELSVLAAESLPPSVRPFLVGDDPRGALITALEKRLQDAESPATAAQRLEIALLRREKAGQDPRPGDGALAELVPQVDVQRRALLEALQRDVAVHPRDQAALLAPWGEDSLVAQLGCEQLGGPATACPAHRRGPWLVARLFAITLLPALLLLAGLVLLSRTLWFALRGRLPAPPPLVGPPLSLVDATLVIAGGFVLLGEVLLPAFTQAGLTRVLASMGLSATTRQGVDVMATYLTLMVAPLGLMALLLPRQISPPRGGWLQWGWRPANAVWLPAVRMLLMVLPIVAWVSWLLQQVWSDPGGSNPLLEMVIGSSDAWALLAFALTAVVLAPLFEETLFRGLLLPVLGRHLGGMGAVLVSALMFALAHLSLGELVPLSVLGIGLGLLRWQSGRLAASVCLHAFWNGLTLFNLLLLSK